MKVGQKVIHNRYGLAEIVSEWPSYNPNYKAGVTIVLLTDEGKSLFKKDRKGYLPRCYEDDFSKLKPVQ